jgi:protein-disulfide isomerase
MQWTVVVFLLSYVGFASFAPIIPPIPVMDTEQGIRHVPVEPRPAVQWEFFADLTCPDSELAWPIALQVQQYYGASRLDLVLQQIPVPYHKNGLISTQGLYVVQQQTPDFVFQFVDAVHAQSTELSTANTANKTETQIVAELADIAVASTGIDRDLFINQIGLYRVQAVTAYKYAVKRGAAATPTYFVNGVDVVVGTNYVPTFDEWIAFFDPIFASS